MLTLLFLAILAALFQAAAPAGGGDLVVRAAAAAAFAKVLVDAVKATPLNTLCLIALACTTAGFRACSARERTAADNVTAGLSVAARSVEPGIETVRAFREAGKVEPATSLALARAALDANSAAWRFTRA